MATGTVNTAFSLLSVTGTYSYVGQAFTLIAHDDVPSQRVYIGYMQAASTGAYGYIYTAYAQVAKRADPDVGGGALPQGAYETEDILLTIYTDLIFPECLSYGSTLSPSYNTEKITVASGSEQRNSRHEFPKFKYDINIENFDAKDIADVVRIFHVCSGEHIGFLFLDPADHSSNDGTYWVSESTVSDTDQLVGTVVGGIAAYPLYKYYTINGRQKRRRIRYPKTDTMVVSVDGYSTTDFLWNSSTHQIEFTAAFGSNTFTGDLTGNVITGMDFSSLSVGSLVYVDGFADSGNNFPLGGYPLRVTAADATSLTLQQYDGTAYGAADETGVSINVVQTTPPAAAVVKAGFWFYTAVRFDDDTLPFTPEGGLAETFIGGFRNLKLVELFE